MKKHQQYSDGFRIFVLDLYATQLESGFGEDFSNVQVVTGQAAPLASMNARAAAQGDTVVFGDSSPDKETVAHELTHVVQQRNAGSTEAATDPAALSAVSAPGDTAEREAESVASTIASGGEAQQISAPPQRRGPPRPAQLAGRRLQPPRQRRSPG